MVKLCRFIFVLLILVSFTKADASTISRPILNSGLVGYWNFEEGRDNSVAGDRSGFGNNGTLTNMNTSTAWTGSATSSGQALDFDASNDYVDAGSGTMLDNLGPMTVSAWYYARGEGENARGGIFNKGDGNGALADGPEFEFGSVGIDGVDRTNAFAFWVPFSGTSLIRIASDNTVTLNKWQFVTVTWDGSNSSANVHIYIDGVEVTYQKSQDAVGTKNDDSSANMLVGIGNFGAQSNTWDGRLDEVRVYRRVLSYDEIQRLYKIQKPRVSGGLTANGLTAYWAFEEGSGTRAEDSSLNSSTGTLTSGPTWVNGKNGKALFFDGVDDFVSIPNTSGVTPPNAITIAAWVKATTTTVTQSIIDDDNNGSIGYFLRINSSGKLFGRITGTTITGNTTLQPNTWYHVALVYDGANVYVYLNGISDATPVARTGTITYSGSTKAIGKRPASGAQFNGTIDEFRMYDRGLSSSEVYSLYKGSVATVVNKSKTNRITNGLVGYWTFDGNKIAGVTAYDSSSSGNNGTMTNGPTPTIGKVGQALRFDGTDDYVSIGNSSTYSFERTDSFSVSLWFYKNIITNPMGLFSKQNTTAGQFTGYNLSIGNGTLQPSFVLESNTSNLISVSVPAVSAATWHHIVVTYNGNSNVSGVNIYVDGVSQSLTTASNTLSASIINTVAPQISGRNGANQLSAGAIDDVRLYNRVLTSDEALALYNIGR